MAGRDGSRNRNCGDGRMNVHGSGDNQRGPKKGGSCPFRSDIRRDMRSAGADMMRGANIDVIYTTLPANASSSDILTI